MQATARTCCRKEVEARVSRQKCLQIDSTANFPFGLVHFPEPAEQLPSSHRQQQAPCCVSGSVEFSNCPLKT